MEEPDVASAVSGCLHGASEAAEGEQARAAWLNELLPAPFGKLLPVGRSSSCLFPFRSALTACIMSLRM